MAFFQPYHPTRQCCKHSGHLFCWRRCGRVYWGSAIFIFISLFPSRKYFNFNLYIILKTWTNTSKHKKNMQKYKIENIYNENMTRNIFVHSKFCIASETHQSMFYSQGYRTGLTQFTHNLSSFTTLCFDTYSHFGIHSIQLLSFRNMSCWISV